MKDRRNGEKFAAKAFSKDFLRTQRFGEEGVKNEIFILRMLNHPNTISFHEVHETKNSIYVITELLKGRQIFRLTDGRLSSGKTKFVLKSVLQALSYLDDKGIVHRDLKPDNIIFKYPENGDSSQNLVKLVDFGLSTFCDLDSYLFVRCGTPGFVAPEIINAKKKQKSLKLTPKSDVFSAGIIFYYMLTGIIPYDGDDFSEVLKNNKRAIIDFNIKELETVNPTEMNLLRSMLNLNIEKRLTAKECLNHPYFVEEICVGSEENLLDDSSSEIIEDGIHSEKIRKIQNKYNIKPKKFRDINTSQIIKKQHQDEANRPPKNIFRITSISTSKFTGSKKSIMTQSSNKNNKQIERKNSIYRRALMKGINSTKKVKLPKVSRENSLSAWSGREGLSNLTTKFMD